MKPIRATNPGISLLSARIGLIVIFKESLGNRVPILCRVGSKLGACTIPGTWKVLMPYDAHPSHESRDIHAPARIGLIVI